VSRLEEHGNDPWSPIKETEARVLTVDVLYAVAQSNLAVADEIRSLRETLERHVLGRDEIV
jgi:hypothetical protein